MNELEGKRIKDLEHALSVVLSLRIAVDNTSFANAKYITLSELATAIGANTTGYIYPTAVKGLLDLNITEAEVVTADAYALKKLIDPVFAYFYLQAVEPTFTNRLNLDGELHTTNLVSNLIKLLSGTINGVLELDSDKNVIATKILGSIATKTFWTGTLVAYDAIVTKDANTIYFIEE